MSATVPLFKEPQGVLMNGAALLYAGAGYVVGFAGLFHDSWAVNAVATLLLAHAMVIAAYVIHECAHNLVFSRARHNAALGRAMSWLCGAAYGTYGTTSTMTTWCGSNTKSSSRGTRSCSGSCAHSSGSTFRRTTW